MSLKQISIDLHRHNRWANEKLLTAIPSGIEDLEFVSSFTSIRKTAYHIWDADWYWLMRLHGNDVSFCPPSGIFEGTFLEGIQKLLMKEDEILVFLESQDEVYFNTALIYKNTKEDEFTHTIFNVLQHLAMHSMFHRGQLVTLLRQVGATKIPATDLIVYFREGN